MARGLSGWTALVGVDGGLGNLDDPGLVAFQPVDAGVLRDALVSRPDRARLFLFGDGWESFSTRAWRSAASASCASVHQIQDVFHWLRSTL